MARLPAPERRRQLLDVAVEVFADRGFHQTSVQELADAAGVTKPVLYQHFGSKRELYRELLDDISEQLRTAVAKAAAVAEGPRQQVEDGFRTYFGYVTENRSAFALLFGSGPRRDPDFAAAATRVEDLIAATIAGLIDVAGLSPEDRTTLAHGIVGLTEGVSRHWAQRGFEPDAEVLAARCAELAWAGLRGVRSPTTLSEEATPEAAPPREPITDHQPIPTQEKAE